LEAAVLGDRNADCGSVQEGGASFDALPYENGVALRFIVLFGEPDAV
jgi:hypothetical protein